jgi:outer membrane protein assembly factor BamB
MRCMHQAWLARVPSVVFRLSLCVLVLVIGTRLRADDWPEWRGKGRLGVWSETGILTRFPPGGLKPAWRTPINSGYSGPAVSGGRVFVTDSRRTDGNRAVERAVALDERTGQVLWTTEWATNYSGLQLVYAIGPRATPTVDGDRVYVLGSMGELLALDARTGATSWRKDFVKDFGAAVPAWGMSGAPLVDGDRLICLVGGEPDAKVVALDKFTGKEIWRALPSDSEPGYNQPTIIEAAGVRQLIIWHPKAISALNPVTGKIYWEVPYAVEMGLTIPTPVRSGPYLFVTSQYNGGRMLKLDEVTPGATLLWRGAGESDRGFPTPNAVNSIIGTPVMQDGYLYAFDNYGILRCLEIATGKLVWETRQVLKERALHGTAFFVRNGDRYFINNDRGELVIAKLSPAGFEEIDRTKLIEPTNPYVRRRELPYVLWSHAAYANKHILIRNDNEIVSYSLAGGS